MQESLDPTKPEESVLLQKLTELLGDYFTRIVAVDVLWAREIVGVSNS